MQLLLLLFTMFLLLFQQNHCRSQTIKELKTHVYYFASDDLQGRATGSEGMLAAARYIIKECQEYNIPAIMIPVGNCQNTVAWIEGRNKDKIIVIGAHLDHVGIVRGRICNGADDNASGSAVLLGLAKRFSESTPNYTLVFVWFTGEEIGFLGSKAYVKSPRFPIKNHIFMLNLDMVGRLKQSWSGEPIDIPIILQELYGKYPFAESITFREGRRSDHVSFAEYMPVAWLFTGTHSDYHKPSDDADKINYEGMVKVCDYAYDLINVVLGESEVNDYILYGLPIYEAP